ncbi:unnamed protein product [Adineta steineri]|uniref:Uncharacterized protein n=1 Tax=Adineta steineri TaxID=433720 RepID=A0A814T2R3_9BILA|nr:unnamed protein product [Adineta steineri]CAF1487395.1 unnamed protein product [Adineta steineri]
MQTHVVTVTSPSVDQFEHLSDEYPNTIVCPCSQTNIRYDQFMLFNPRYHQVCSSQFVSQQFISTLFNINMSRFSPLDFRLMAMSQFQVLALLCQTAASTINNDLNQFLTQQMVTSRALSREVFEAQVVALVEQMQTTTTANVNDFVAEQWWGYLWGTDIAPNFLDLQLLSIHFRILASLCSLAQQSIDNDTSAFLTNKLVTFEAMSFSSFQAQIDSLTATFIAQTSDKFRRTQLFIYETFRANQLLVVPETNWQFVRTTAADNYVLATVPRSSFGNNYSCITTLDSFPRPLYIDANSNTIALPGVVGGCLPIDGARLSTLECFFNSNCILNLASIQLTRPTTFWLAKPLNTSTPSIYPSNTLISSLVDSLFVEDWGIKIEFLRGIKECNNMSFVFYPV